jgi:hypothetical protein
MNRQTGSAFYADLLLREWEIPFDSRIENCLRQVLEEMQPSAQLFLRNEPKLQVLAHPDALHSVWAYFPIHNQRIIVSRLNIEVKPSARVLLLLRTEDTDSDSEFMDYLRDHLGHVLLYLRSPRLRNECEDAGREWRNAVLPLRNSLGGRQKLTKIKS